MHKKKAVSLLLHKVSSYPSDKNVFLAVEISSLWMQLVDLIIALTLLWNKLYLMFTSEFSAVKYMFCQAVCVCRAIYQLKRAAVHCRKKSCKWTALFCMLGVIFIQPYTLAAFCYPKANGTVGDTKVGFAGLLALYHWKLNGKFVVQRPAKRWITADKFSRAVLT